MVWIRLHKPKWFALNINWFITIWGSVFQINFQVYPMLSLYSSFFSKQSYLNFLLRNGYFEKKETNRKLR